MRNWIYNLSNIFGIILISTGFGVINNAYGFIAGGGVLILLNLYNDRTSEG